MEGSRDQHLPWEWLHIPARRTPASPGGWRATLRGGGSPTCRCRDTDVESRAARLSVGFRGKNKLMLHFRLKHGSIAPIKSTEEGRTSPAWVVYVDPEPPNVYLE